MRNWREYAKIEKTMKSKYTPQTDTLRVGRSSAGLGLFSTEDIEAGICLIEYVGRQVSKEEEDTSKSKYLFEIKKGLTIDGKPKWNKAGYINHACEPNAETKIHKNRVYVFSLRAIAAGEEITYDYGEEYVNEHIAPHGCKCRAH